MSLLNFRMLCLIFNMSPPTCSNNLLEHTSPIFIPIHTPPAFLYIIFIHNPHKPPLQNHHHHHHCCYSNLLFFDLLSSKIDLWRKLCLFHFQPVFEFNYYTYMEETKKKSSSPANRSSYDLARSHLFVSGFYCWSWEFLTALMLFSY
ncbi:hypothetical protein Hdeb2414_s0012g00384671 [Helianthus debilis subsp. tardiflorus]